MKLSPVTILAAVLCFSAASAAPSTLIDLPAQFGWNPSKDLPWAKYYDCLINLLGEISKSNGEAETWSKYQPELQNHVNEWKKCYEGDRPDFDSCNKKEGQATYAVMEKYMQLIAKKNLAILKEFVAKQGKCYEEEQSNVLGREISNDFPWAEYIECYVNFLDKVSKDFQLSEMWAPYRSQVRTHINELKKCNKPGNKDSVEMYSSCNELEGHAIYKLLEEYLLTMYSVEPEAFRTFMEALVTKCQNI